MSRTKKVTPGRILFVGAGPGDPDLLTVRARSVLTNATIAYIDPDVPPGVVDLIGSAHRPEVAPTPRRTKAAEVERVQDDDGDVAVEEGAEDPVSVHPALGDPADVAKTLVASAKAGVDVVRVVAGDPLTSNAVLAEVTAVTRTSVAFEVLPGLPAAAVVPSYAGMPLGSGYTVADVRGDVDWAGLAAAPGPLVLHGTASHLAQAAAALIESGLAAGTPVAITINGTTCAQRTIEATLETAAEHGGELAGPLLLTVGKVVAQRGKLSWWESRALYGWTVLVPRTKEQAAEMSERLVGHGAIPKEVPTIAVEPPRSPAQMERAVKGLVDGTGPPLSDPLARGVSWVQDPGIGSSFGEFICGVLAAALVAHQPLQDAPPPGIAELAQMLAQALAAAGIDPGAPHLRPTTTEAA